MGSASGGFAGAIILDESALGVGIALGPLVGGELGGVSWRGPFFGVAVLMAIALVAVIVAGVFIGVNNTVATQAVMTVAPVERPIASASYGFVRFIGGGLAPYFAGRLADRYGIHVAFYVAAAAVVAAIVILASGHRLLAQAEAGTVVDEEEEALVEELGSAS